MSQSNNANVLASELINDPNQPLLARTPLAHFQSYYRGQTFIAQVGMNSLVTAAAPLFSLVSKLQETTDYPDVINLHEHLVHEVKAFEAHAQSLGCRSEIILVGRYVLCALLDEVILNTTWGNETSWGKYKLLNYFQREVNADERFFTIMQRLREDAKIYIDILELMYLTLSLGFMGKYRYLPDGFMQHQNLLLNLYQTIRQQRGEVVKALTQITSPNTPTAPPNKPALSPWTVLSIATLLSIGVFFGLNYLFKITSAPLHQGLSNIIAYSPGS